MSYRPMFSFPGGELAGNAQRFATRGEAEASAEARFMVWMAPGGWVVETSTDPVNYQRVAGRDQSLTPATEFLTPPAMEG